VTAHNTPPVHDLDAEASVLSTLMLDPERIASLETVLRPGDFYSDANRRIAEAIWALDADGARVDVTTIAGRLRATEQLQGVGGTPYLSQLLDATPSVANVVAHARTVAVAARVRRVQDVCRLVAAEAYTMPLDPEEWLQSVEKRVFAATDSSSMSADTITVLSDAVDEERASMQERAVTKKSLGRSTKITQLDGIFGGLVDAVPYILAGRPGHGKTALCWQIVEGIARDGALGVMLSQEMPRPQLVQRAIAQAANIEVRQIQRCWLSAEEWQLVDSATSYVANLPIAIDDRGGHTIHSVRSAVRRSVQKLRAKGHTGPLGIIALDYLQIMASDGASRRESRSTEVSDNMHALTAMAKEFRCPVLVLSQLNRDIEKRPDKRPKLSDLNESGAIEADGYGIMFVYREDCYRPKEAHDGKAEIIVAKNRNGRTGTAKLRYLPSTFFAGDADADQDAEQAEMYQ
jgi:replicative DNA helicase